MNGKSKVISYTRNPQTRNMVAPYKSKFAQWIRLVAEANLTHMKGIVVAEP